MHESAPSDQINVAGRPSGISRFNEQFSESSCSGAPPHTAPAIATCPTGSANLIHIIERLRVGRCQQSKSKGKLGRTVARQGSKRPSSPTIEAYERRRSIARQTVDEHRHAKRARQKHEEEHKHKARLSGSAWGYDPMAGRISNGQHVDDRVRGCYIFRGARTNSDEYGVEEVDMLGRRTGRQWLHGSKWGVESSGPGRQPHFERADVGQLEETNNLATLTRKRTRRKSYSPWPQVQSPSA